MTNNEIKSIIRRVDSIWLNIIDMSISRYSEERDRLKAEAEALEKEVEEATGRPFDEVREYFKKQETMRDIRCRIM